MKKIMLSALLAITLCNPCVCQYNPDGVPDPPNGGSNPDAGSVPINTGLYLLLAAGLFYGVIKISKSEKENQRLSVILDKIHDTEKGDSKSLKKDLGIDYKHIQSLNLAISQPSNSKWTDYYLCKFRWYRKWRGCTWYKHKFTLDALELSCTFVGTFWAIYGNVNRYSEVVEMELW